VRAEDEVAALYTRAAPSFGQIGAPMFPHAGRRLVELARIEPGQRVLDVAAGRGAVLFPAAERVGPSGHVLGIDVSAGMVEHTTTEIHARGLSHAQMRHMDADRLDLPSGSFDAVLCSFAIFFMKDVHDALRGFARVLVRGGTLGCAFARGTDPRWRWYEARLAEYVELAPFSQQHGLSIREPAALVDAMQHAGFEDVTETVEPTELFFADPGEWWASLWTHGTRRALERLTPPKLEQFQTECLARVQLQVTPRGLPISYQFVYVLGRSPNVRRPT
jgi:ubiquinone/menaquinone biosynthesis C-methylase UbiE